MLESEKLKQDAVLQTGKDHAHLDLVNDAAARKVLQSMNDYGQVASVVDSLVNTVVLQDKEENPIHLPIDPMIRGQGFVDVEEDDAQREISAEQIEKTVFVPFEDIELEEHQRAQSPRTKGAPKWLKTIEDVAKLEVDAADIKSRKSAEEESKGEDIKINFETATMQSTGPKQMSSAEASDIIDKIMAETANPLTLSINAKKWGVAYKSTADAIIKETRDKASNLVYNKPVARQFEIVMSDFNKNNPKLSDPQGRSALLKEYLLTKFIKVNDQVDVPLNVPKDA